MLTRERLIERSRAFSRPVAPAVSVLRFGPHDFKAPASGQRVELHRAEPGAFVDPVDFWLTSLSLLHDGDALSLAIDDSLCRPLAPPAFIRFFEGCQGALADPTRLAEPRGIEQALEMHEHWDRQAALALAEGRLLALHWSTRL